MTLQRGTSVGWKASGKERRKVASEPDGERRSLTDSENGWQAYL